MYFDNCKTMEDAKNKYRQLSKYLHPDVGGDEDLMCEVNLALSEFIEMYSREIKQESCEDVYTRHDPILDKIDMILSWAELPENNGFSAGFVRSIRDQYIRRKWISKKQRDSLDGIIDSYDIQP